jgi:hypothetical protein
LFTFDLMQVALTPVVAADIKRAVEEQILLRIESLSAGEPSECGGAPPPGCGIANDKDVRWWRWRRIRASSKRRL